MDRIMQFILYSREESLSHITARIIVDSSRIYIRHLLIEVTLTAADIPDTLQKLTEIPVSALLQPLIIHRKSLLNIFMKPLRRPSAETHSNLRLNTIAESDDHVEIIVDNISLHLTVPFLTNCQEILDSSIRIQFSILKALLRLGVLHSIIAPR